MTANDVGNAVAEVQDAGDTVLAILEAADPAVELPAEAAANVLNLVGGMVTKALSAWSAAAGVPITPEAMAALAPNATPLDQPDTPA